MICASCRKKIPDGTRLCPECGAAQRGTTPSPASNTRNYTNPVNRSAVQEKSYNKMCIIGLVISGISLFLNFWGIVGIAGTIVSVLGLINCKQTNEKGKVLAIVGIVIGAFSICYALAVMS